MIPHFKEKVLINNLFQRFKALWSKILPQDLKTFVYFFLAHPLSDHSLICFQVSIYHALSVLSYFICLCISFGGFSPAAVPSYVLFPIVIGDMICACIKLRKTPEVEEGVAKMRAEGN